MYFSCLCYFSITQASLTEVVVPLQSLLPYFYPCRFLIKPHLLKRWNMFFRGLMRWVKPRYHTFISHICFASLRIPNRRICPALLCHAHTLFFHIGGGQRDRHSASFRPGCKYTPVFLLCLSRWRLPIFSGTRQPYCKYYAPLS